ncbi:E3 ubiquitin-protein ligase TRIM69-like [Carcharodon carcharias]|uniref:E3 ubiquitin-protein ligase TRIM69-like n=1 Tax=Carcharodon carcharias TaxID=13397 RepID=UPI001B7E16CA|nr:E3 ubiquitin-protein ligase TRIM69-like [Carcharodon carcharias]
MGPRRSLSALKRAQSRSPYTTSLCLKYLKLLEDFAEVRFHFGEVKYTFGLLKNRHEYDTKIGNIMVDCADKRQMKFNAEKLTASHSCSLPVPEALTRDPETANNQLSISQDLTSVRFGDEEQDLPDQPQRFERLLCILSSQSFSSERQYWEVDLGKKPLWVVSVCRESISRKGSIQPSPDNGFRVIARLPDCKSLKIPDVISQLKVKPRKLGVYLDYEGGQVSFYDVEDMSHLHTFTDTFTEKLYPIFNPCKTDTADDTDPLRLLTS